MALTVHNSGVIADAPFTADEARHITDQLREHLEEDYQLIIDAYQRRAWTALGYHTWDDYCSAEFGDIRLKLPREERQDVVRSLRDSGLSLRAIEAATGVSRHTVINDLRQPEQDDPQVVQSAPPEPDPDDEVVDAEIVDEEPAPHQVTGTDGKTYKITPKPKAEPKRTPLPDLAKDVGWELRRAVEKLERIIDDDRYRANRDAIALHLRPHLNHAASTCQTILDELNQ